MVLQTNGNILLLTAGLMFQTPAVNVLARIPEQLLGLDIAILEQLELALLVGLHFRHSSDVAVL